MTEINITKFFAETTAKDYSASIAEIGENAGRFTWQAAIESAEDYVFITLENREEFSAYLGGFGAWSDDEISAMPLTELNAMFIQLVAGEIREAGLNQSAPDWPKYEADGQAGKISGNLFKGDDGQIYYTIAR